MLCCMVFIYFACSLEIYGPLAAPPSVLEDPLVTSRDPLLGVCF